jgi:vesicle-fusing ATPase
MVNPEKSQQIVLEEMDERPPIFEPDWSFADMGIGGLDAEFGTLFRRAFASRVFPPSVVESLGIKHVKGMLLHGPPGTGKTLIARQIGRLLKGREPKIVNGPEILNKYVGQSEENIRLLFKEAEAEQKAKGENSSLHIIIFDEIDAICKQRGTVSGSVGVHDTVVNQLLSKIDGVHSLNNILVIGMTNQKDMIDHALLRPGRLEVHIEIGLPNAAGREEILHIHTKKMRETGKLGDNVDLKRLAAITKNFSGAELEGLVKSASSFALYNLVEVNDGQVDVRIPSITPKEDAASFNPKKMDVKLGDVKEASNANGKDNTIVQASELVVKMAHFERALMEVLPAFGFADNELKTMTRGALIDYSPQFVRLKKIGWTCASQVRNSERTPLLSLLLEGDVGSGKTAVAGQLALDANFPYTKVISPEMFVGFSETAKCTAIKKTFEDAYKSPLSLIVLDNVERLIEYVAIGPRFSNQVLQTLLVLIKRIPSSQRLLTPSAATADHRLLVVATTSSMRILKDLEFEKAFNVIAHVNSLTKAEHVVTVFQHLDVKIDEKEMTEIASRIPFPMPIKQLLMLVEMTRATDAKQNVTASQFFSCATDSGVIPEVSLRGKEKDAHVNAFDSVNELVMLVMR